MVFISNLNKNLFPLYLPPEKDELLSSWLCRTSHNHQVKTNTFLQNYFSESIPFWNRDIDVSAPKEILDVIERHTPLTTEEIENLLLKSFESFAYEKLNVNGITPNILSLGIKHRLRTRFGQQCCPKCMSKEIIHYKKTWRLSSSLICLECNCVLIDRCSNCFHPITFYRVNMGGNKIKSTMEFESMNLCSNCRVDLSSFKNISKPNLLEIEYQKFIDFSIENGYNKIANYSFTFFRVLFLLSLRLRRDTKTNRFKSYVEETYKVKFENYPLNISSWNLEQRRATFPFVFRLLKNYPEEMQNILFEGKVMRAYLVKDDQDLPYWFEKLFYY